MVVYVLDSFLESLAHAGVTYSNSPWAGQEMGAPISLKEEMGQT